MTKTILTIAALILFTAIFAGCTATQNALPDPYNDLYNTQQETTKKIADISQKLEKTINQPEALTEQATALDKFIREQKDTLARMSVSEAENNKSKTIQELDTVKMLASSIKNNAKKLQEKPNDETAKKLISGYISRLKTQSAKIEALQVELKQIAFPDQEIADPEPVIQPNPRASEATI